MAVDVTEVQVPGSNRGKFVSDIFVHIFACLAVYLTQFSTL